MAEETTRTPGDWRWKSLLEIHGDDFKAAYAEASRLSHELRDLCGSEAVVRAQYESEIAEAEEGLAAGRAYLAQVEADLAGLKARAAAALAPIAESQDLRRGKLYEFCRDYNRNLRIRKGGRSASFPGGKLAWTQHGEKEKVIEQVGPDGNPLPGKTDEAAILEVLAVLNRVGLNEQHAELVDLRPKVALVEVKKHLLLDEDGSPVLQLTTGDLPQATLDRIANEGGTYWPTVDKATGQVLGYTLTFPAVQVVRDADGNVLSRRELLRRVAPEEAVTLKFVPAQPGTVEETEPEEGVPDGDGQADEWE